MIIGSGSLIGTITGFGTVSFGFARNEDIADKSFVCQLLLASGSGFSVATFWNEG